MENKILNCGKRWFGVIIAGLFVLTFAMGHLALAGQTGKTVLGSATANQEIARALEFDKVQKKFLEAVNARVAQVTVDAIFQRKIAEFPVAEKMAAVVNAIEGAKSRGFDMDVLLQTASKQRLDVLAAAGGTLGGTVLVEGVAPTGFAEVVAFTLNGFFAGASGVDGAGGYAIADLPAGDYYVVTHSSFVDEFYDNIPAAGFINWRDATPVTVADGGARTDIDFDLLEGASVSGHVFEADGTTPIAFRTVDFLLFHADEPGRPHHTSLLTEADGSYSLNVAATGHFKLAAEVFGFSPEFWNGKPDFASADVLDIPDFDTDITDIDFSLDEGAPPEPEGAVIAGTVLGPGQIPMLLSFVFAFDADTTIAGLGVVTDPGTGGYTVAGLDDGDYIVYANNYLGFIDPSFPYVRGEYFDDAPTPDLATPVTVAGVDTTFDIDFMLESGGAIAGTITDDTGAALDSVLVIGLKLDLASLGDCFPNCFFFEYIDLSVAFSGSDGVYTLGGLSSGDYTLRTVTLFGPNAGLVVDEYYDDVKGLFDFADAMPVTVADPDTTADIDFVLDRGGSISGRLVEAFDGETPVVGDPLVLVLDADTGIPALAIPHIDPSTMDYFVGPLVTGSYKLLGVVTPDDGTTDPLDPVLYLPQFWDGKGTFNDADVVAVTAPTPTAGIDFNMVRAGSITGRVDLSAGVPVGADSLFETFVIAYEATTGAVAAGSETNFAGGYRIFGLPPGSYKVAALPVFPGYAVAYSGGGSTFDDANTTELTVAPGAVVTADISLNSGNGFITGNVTNLDGSLPLDGVLLLAYDGSGHVVSVGVSGLLDLPGGAPSNGLSADLDGEASSPGEYVIPGLASGNYYVRTFSLFQIFLLLDQLDNVNGDLGDDPLAAIFGLLAGAGDFAGGLELQLYADAYYPNLVILPADGDIDLFSLIFSLVLNDGDPEGLIPFADGIPEGAGQVAVTSPGVTGGIDFRLPKLADVLTSVDGPEQTTVVPQAFGLSQNYPNPFNPSTLIRYDVPETARVTLRVYNMLGQQIRTLHDGLIEAGSHQVQWDGADARGEQVAAGIYFLRMKSENFVLTRKMLFVK